MKKFSLIMFVLFSLLFFVSCGSDDDETSDTGDTASADTGDTEAADTGDTEAADTGDTEAADTGDTEAADTGDTEAADTGDTEEPADTGDTDTDTGDTETPEPGECTTISFGAMKFDGSADSYAYFSGPYIPGTGSAQADEIDLEIYSETAAGTFDLTEGYNASYSSCTQCVMVYEDIAYDNDGYFEGAGKYYYQASGTVTINSFDYSGGHISAVFEDVKLIQVTRTYDSENDRFNAEPVEGGACLYIENSAVNL